MSKFVFLDRDDTIIYNVPYLSDPEQVRLTPFAAKALRLLADNGFRLAMVSNQSGIGRGFFTLAQLEAVNARLAQRLEYEANVRLDAVYFCPHAPEENCNCRKPKTGMLEQACRDFDVDKALSFMVGDGACDINLGKAFGLKTIQIVLPHKPLKHLDADYTAPNLLKAAKFILASSK